MHGQVVCKMHGGKSPQALAKAEDRMRQLVHPAVSSLARQIENDEFNAVRYVLDWAGFKAIEKIQGEQDVTIRLVREDAQPLILERVQRLNNGNGNGRTHD